MNEYACNYSLLRFLPYRDSGEFVNIGVVLSCGPLGFLDFCIETRRWARLSHFFPELDLQIYRSGLHSLSEELDRWRNEARRLPERAPEQRERLLNHLFGELTRPRESIFYFAEPRTVLAHDPQQILRSLFDQYVHRSFHADAAPGQKELKQKIA